MTSYRQIEANRRNALKSTGPKTEAGKQTSRCNAVRHGLTAETVITAGGRRRLQSIRGSNHCGLRCSVSSGTRACAAIGQAFLKDVHG
jgi:hypothetical protein